MLISSQVVSRGYNHQTKQQFTVENLDPLQKECSSEMEKAEAIQTVDKKIRQYFVRWEKN